MSYNPSLNLYGMLSDLGDTVGGAFKQARQQQYLSQLGGDLANNDYAAATQRAFQNSDLNTGLSLLKLGQQQSGNAATDAWLNGGVAQPQAGAQPTSIPSGDPSRGIMAFFQSKGLPSHAAAALAAQFKAESQGNPAAANPGDGADGSTSIGVGQWNGPRAVALRQYASANNLDPNALGTQLNFAWSELQGSERATLERLMRSRDINDASAAAIGYERPAGWSAANPAGAKDYQRRLGYAQTLAGPGGVQVASNNPGFVPGGAIAYAPAQQPAESPTIGDDDYAGTQGGSSAIASVANSRPAPQATATATDDQPDSAKLTALRNRQRMGISLLARTQDEGRRKAIETQLGIIGKQIADEENGVTTLTPEQVAAIPQLQGYPGIVQKDRNGKFLFPGAGQQGISPQKIQSEADSALAKAKIQPVIDAIGAAPDARTKLATLSQLADVWNTSEKEIMTGPGAETALKLKQLAKNVGIDVGNVAPSELVQKIGTQLAAVASKSLTSRPTQFDFQVFLQNNPGLTLTAQGNKMLINLMQQQAKHELGIANLARQQKNGDNWDQVVEAYDKAHPIVSPITGKALDPYAVISPGPSQGGGAPGAGPVPPDALAQARAAIASGAPRDAVIQRLRQNGIDASGL